MTRTRLLAALAGAALVLTPLLAGAQPRYDFGKHEYDSNCAVCHGPGARGDGPFMRFMTYKKTGTEDLTQIARRNGGTFPFQKVYEQIDGSLEVEVHGPRDMPVWGRDYRMLAREAQRTYDFDVVGPYNPELYARSRILALVDYLNRLQVR